MGSIKSTVNRETGWPMLSYAHVDREEFLTDCLGGIYESRMHSLCECDGSINEEFENLTIYNFCFIPPLDASCDVFLEIQTFLRETLVYFNVFHWEIFIVVPALMNYVKLKIYVKLNKKTNIINNPID